MVFIMVINIVVCFRWVRPFEDTVIQTGEIVSFPLQNYFEIPNWFDVIFETSPQANLTSFSETSQKTFVIEKDELDIFGQKANGNFIHDQLYTNNHNNVDYIYLLDKNANGLVRLSIDQYSGSLYNKQVWPLPKNLTAKFLKIYDDSVYFGVTENSTQFPKNQIYQFDLDLNSTNYKVWDLNKKFSIISDKKDFEFKKISWKIIGQQDPKDYYIVYEVANPISKRFTENSKVIYVFEFLAKGFEFVASIDLESFGSLLDSKKITGIKRIVNIGDSLSVLASNCILNQGRCMKDGSSLFVNVKPKDSAMAAFDTENIFPDLSETVDINKNSSKQKIGQVSTTAILYQNYTMKICTYNSQTKFFDECVEDSINFRSSEFLEKVSLENSNAEQSSILLAYARTFEGSKNSDIQYDSLYKLNENIKIIQAYTGNNIKYKVALPYKPSLTKDFIYFFNNQKNSIETYQTIAPIMQIRGDTFNTTGLVEKFYVNAYNRTTNLIFDQQIISVFKIDKFSDLVNIYQTMKTYKVYSSSRFNGMLLNSAESQFQANGNAFFELEGTSLDITSNIQLKSQFFQTAEFIEINYVFEQIFKAQNNLSNTQSGQNWLFMKTPIIRQYSSFYSQVMVFKCQSWMKKYRPTTLMCDMNNMSNIWVDRIEVITKVFAYEDSWYFITENNQTKKTIVYANDFYFNYNCHFISDILIDSLILPTITLSYRRAQLITIETLNPETVNFYEIEYGHKSNQLTKLDQLEINKSTSKIPNFCPKKIIPSSESYSEFFVQNSCTGKPLQMIKYRLVSKSDDSIEITSGFQLEALVQLDTFNNASDKTASFCPQGGTVQTHSITEDQKGYGVWGTTFGDSSEGSLQLFDQNDLGFATMEYFQCVTMAGALVGVGKDHDGLYMGIVFRGNQTKFANNRDSGLIKFKSTDVRRVDVLVHDYDIVLVGFNNLMLVQEIYYVFVSQYQIFLEDSTKSFIEKYDLDSGSGNTVTVNNNIQATINISASNFPIATIENTKKPKPKVQQGLLDLECGQDFRGPIFDIKLKHINKTHFFFEDFSSDKPNLQGHQERFSLQKRVYQKESLAATDNIQRLIKSVSKANDKLFQLVQKTYNPRQNDTAIYVKYTYLEIYNQQDDNSQTQFLTSHLFTNLLCQSQQVSYFDSFYYAFSLCNGGFNSVLQILILNENFYESAMEKTFRKPYQKQRKILDGLYNRMKVLSLKNGNFAFVLHRKTSIQEYMTIGYAFISLQLDPQNNLKDIYRLEIVENQFKYKDISCFDVTSDDNILFVVSHNKLISETNASIFEAIKEKLILVAELKQPGQIRDHDDDKNLIMVNSLACQTIMSQNYECAIDIGQKTIPLIQFSLVFSGVLKQRNLVIKSQKSESTFVIFGDFSPSKWSMKLTSQYLVFSSTYDTSNYDLSESFDQFSRPFTDSSMLGNQAVLVYNRAHKNSNRIHVFDSIPFALKNSEKELIGDEILLTNTTLHILHSEVTSALYNTYAKYQISDSYKIQIDDVQDFIDHSAIYNLVINDVYFEASTFTSIRDGIDFTGYNLFDWKWIVIQTLGSSMVVGTIIGIIVFQLCKKKLRRKVGDMQMLGGRDSDGDLRMLGGRDSEYMTSDILNLDMSCNKNCKNNSKNTVSFKFTIFEQQEEFEKTFTDETYCSSLDLRNV